MIEAAIGLGIVIGVAGKTALDRFKSKVRDRLHEEVNDILEERDQDQ